MPKNISEFTNSIILATILILILCGFIVLNLVLFYFRRRGHLRAQQALKNTFEQTILQSQLEIQEQTFNDISQEIHDNVGQILSLAKVQLNIIGESNTLNLTLLEDAKENISKAMSDLRDVAKGLSSDRILGVGLDEAVAQEIQRINRSGILSIRMEISGKSHEIEQQKQLILYRVIQECIQNIIKHASASSVLLSFDYHDLDLEIIITDNGKGFDVANEKGNVQGLGLMNMYKRIALIGGQINIHSILHTGTTIKINLLYA
jgi:signal transduction histidine kinase